MTTNLQPVTPLPWSIVSGYKSKDYNKGGVESTFISWGIPGADVDYAVRAANAYPQLVAALRELSAVQWQGHVLPDAYRNADALLRSLGESA